MIVEWRLWMTQHFLTTYFSARAFFNLTLFHPEVDNPDQVLLCIVECVCGVFVMSSTLLGQRMVNSTPQRICDDVSTFVEDSTRLVNKVVSKLLNCIAFAGTGELVT